MKPITPEIVWDIIKRIDQRRFMANPFFLILNCQYEEVDGKYVIYWDEKTVIFPPGTTPPLCHRQLWGFQHEIDELKGQNVTIKEVLPWATEYFYHTKDLAELKGKDYKKLRNKIHAFKKKYPDYKVLWAYDEKSTKNFITTWFEKNIAKKAGLHKETLQFEYESSLKTIDLLSKVTGIKSMYVEIGGELAGVTLFCPLYDDFWVSILQKTSYKYQGLAKFMYHEKCIAMQHYPVATFGDDGADPALAASKRELRPFKEELICYANIGGPKA